MYARGMYMRQVSWGVRVIDVGVAHVSLKETTKDASVLSFGIIKLYVRHRYAASYSCVA